jgi:uncharacterized HAD superfamily protein
VGKTPPLIIFKKVFHMKRLIIGLDIDGVIVDYIHSILPLLCEIKGETVKYEDITHPALSKLLDIDEKAAAGIWERILGTDLLQTAPPMSGAIEGLKELGHHEIWLITGRPVSLRDLTVSWLNEKGIKYNRIEFDSGKTTGKLSLERQCDVFIEDLLEAANLLANSGIITLLFNQPWNQTPELPERCRRVYDWSQVLTEVKKLEK